MATRTRLIGAVAALAGSYLGYRYLKERQRRYDFRDRCVLITGGARGLGLVMARQLIREGARVAICSRHEDEVARAVAELNGAGGAVVGSKCDVTDYAQLSDFVTFVEERLGPVDVLINNAGVIQVGPYDEMTDKDFEASMAIHVAAPLNAIRRVAPSMRRRGHGRIVNISSIGGRFSAPHLLPYCTGKFALVGLSQGLHAELARDGVYVTTICPGLMRTGSHRRALFKGRHREEYTWFSLAASSPFLAMSADRAASQIIEAARYGRAHVTLSFIAKTAAAINALAPELAADACRLAIRWLPEPGGIGTKALEGEQSTSEWSPSLATLLGERAAVRNNEISSKAR